MVKKRTASEAFFPRVHSYWDAEGPKQRPKLNIPCLGVPMKGIRNTGKATIRRTNCGVGSDDKSNG